MGRTFLFLRSFCICVWLCDPVGGGVGHGMPFFYFPSGVTVGSLSLKIFATLGITQVNLISALAYSKKSLHLGGV